MRSLGPAEQAVPFQHHAAYAGVCRRHVAQLQAQIEAGALPPKPADLVAIYLARQCLAVGSGGNGDDRVGMDMVDMRGIDEAVQRRVYAGRAGVQTKSAMGEILDHLVLVLHPAIEPLQLTQAIEIQC